MNQSKLSMTKLEEPRAMPADAMTPSDQRELEEWASTVAGCLHQAVPVLPKPLGLGCAAQGAEVPVSWQAGVSAMTPSELESSGVPSTAAVSGTDESTDATNRRIQVRVRTQEYGEIAVVVERMEAGLRILVGAEDARAVTALGQQSQAVRKALENDGQNVEIIEVVRMNAVGTRFASSKVVSNEKIRQARKSETPSSDSGPRKKRTKRIDLTG